MDIYIAYLADSILSTLVFSVEEKISNEQIAGYRAIETPELLLEKTRALLTKPITFYRAIYC